MTWRRQLFDGLDYEDGAEPFVTLSRDNPLRPQSLDDLARRLPDGDGFGAPVDPFHASELPQ